MTFARNKLSCYLNGKILQVLHITVCTIKTCMVDASSTVPFIALSYFHDHRRFKICKILPT